MIKYVYLSICPNQKKRHFTLFDSNSIHQKQRLFNTQPDKDETGTRLFRGADRTMRARQCRKDKGVWKHRRGNSGTAWTVNPCRMTAARHSRLFHVRCGPGAGSSTHGFQRKKRPLKREMPSVRTHPFGRSLILRGHRFEECQPEKFRRSPARLTLPSAACGHCPVHGRSPGGTGSADPGRSDRSGLRPARRIRYGPGPS